jgi:hypothetical protein
MSAYSGTIWGNGKCIVDGAGGYKQGDRVGVLLDLDNGSLRFFKNVGAAWAWLPSGQRDGTSGGSSANVQGGCKCAAAAECRSACRCRIDWKVHRRYE